MRKKLNMELLRQITEKELDNISENEIWLRELVEQVANTYSKHSLNYYPLHSQTYRKIKQSDMIVSKIAQNNGWAAKKKTFSLDYLIDGKILKRQINPTKLYRLQEEE